MYASSHFSSSCTSLFFPSLYVHGHFCTSVWALAEHHCLRALARAPRGLCIHLRRRQPAIALKIEQLVNASAPKLPIHASCLEMTAPGHEDKVTVLVEERTKLHTSGKDFKPLYCVARFHNCCHHDRLIWGGRYNTSALAHCTGPGNGRKVQHISTRTLYRACATGRTQSRSH
jgi:hypothetical protein